MDLTDGPDGLVVVLALCLALCTAVLGFMYGIAVEGRRRKTDIMKLGDAARGAVDDAGRNALAEAEAARTMAQSERERADRYFVCIQDIERERNDWRKLYHRAHEGNSAAQAWLLRDLERTVELANHYAKKHKEPLIGIDPNLRELLSGLAQQAAAPEAATGAGVPPPASSAD